MIRYTLKCACGAGFESWFPSSASYEDQRERGLISCPSCGSVAVEKAVMAPSVARTDRGGMRAEETGAAPPEAPAAGPGSPHPGPQDRPQDGPQASSEASAQAGPREAATPVALMGHPEGELRDLLRRLREHVVAHSDYVGKDFADLARKMHEGEVEHRAIYGEATHEEVEALKEDEVEVFPLPVLPEDRN